MARAYEVMPFLEERTGLQSGPLLAEVLLALGRPDEAMALMERTLVPTPRTVVWWTSGCSGEPGRPPSWSSMARTPATRTSYSVTARPWKASSRCVPGCRVRPRTFRPAGHRGPSQGRPLRGRDGPRAWGPDQVARWRAAVGACADAEMWWEHHCASARLAATLVETGADREEAARLLRATHAYAVEQRAVPLAAKVEEEPGWARIGLTAPAQAPSAVPRPFAGLTAREAEVLRTPGREPDLPRDRCGLAFISEKTVERARVDLLRKTQTSSRREVAALARRVGWGDAPEGTDR